MDALKSRRQRTLLQYITDFYMPLHFEFETKRSLKDCVSYFQRESAEISQIEDRAYAFYIRHSWSNRGPVIEVRGELTQTNSQKWVKVSGSVAPNRWSAASLTILFLLGVSLTAFSLLTGDYFNLIWPLFMVGVSLLVGAALIAEKDKVIDQLERHLLKA